jgi:PHD/YefM family antitoxin component YafN of YafNO toxin-antitoxin module
VNFNKKLKLSLHLIVVRNYGIIAPQGGDLMPHIIPIRDLKNTGAISQMCQEVDEPIYITKNGYGDMVIMSMKLFEDSLFMQNVYNRLAESETNFENGQKSNAKKSLKRIREKYNV